MKAPPDLQETFRRGLKNEMEQRWEACSLVEWLRTHRAEASLILGDKRMDWAHAAELFGQQGLMDGLGEKPTAETAREAWRRVEGRRRAGMALRRAKG